MRYEVKAGGSSKFWDIVLAGKTFRVTWGRIGTVGQTQSKAFKSAGEACVAHDKLVAEKLRKGYRAAKDAKDAKLPKRITEHTKMLRDVASDDDDEHTRVIREGVALTHSEPELVLSGGALYHFSFRNKLLKVAGSFGEFLEHYLAAGCFSSHEFPALWKVVRPHVPVEIPLAKNVWGSAYKKQFPSYWRS